MRPLCRPLLILASAPFLGAAAALAQPLPPPLPPAFDSQSSPVVDNPQSTTASGAADKAQPVVAGAANGAAVSKQTGSEEAAPSPAAMIAAGLPKYDPPKAAPVKSEGQEVDARDVDKPQNGIIRLPNFYVRTARQAVLKDADLVTQKGMADIGMKRYPGLAMAPFSWLNNGIAEEMYREDARLSNISDLTETANAIGRGGDKTESDYIKRATQDTYMQGIDWGGFVPQK
jgi:hypothetical protein